MRFLFVVLIAAFLCACEFAPANTQTATIALGKALFEDARLSADGRISCATCHQPARGFTDGRNTSQGTSSRLGTRNTPGLLDLSQEETFFWDGRESNLQRVVMQPFVAPNEMGLSSHDALLTLLRTAPEYRQLLRAAYGDQDVDPERVAQALVSYLRSLPSLPTRFDTTQLAGSTVRLSLEEQRGLALFRGKAGCDQCHRLQGSPIRLSDGLFHHSGVGFTRAAGKVRTGLQRLQAIPEEALGQLILSDPTIAELGRFAVTRDPRDLGAFRTPSLRNVSHTAPYMHDGSIPDLAAALDYELYYRGLVRGQPIALTPDERQALLSFLHSFDLTN